MMFPPLPSASCIFFLYSFTIFNSYSGDKTTFEYFFIEAKIAASLTSAILALGAAEIG